MKELHLVATYVKHLRPGINPSTKNVMSNPDNYQFDERVEFTRGLKSRDISTAGIILNLNKKSVVKNTYNPEQKDFKSLFVYFLEAYPQYVAQAMAELDLEYLKQFLPAEETVEAATEQ